ncbi:TIGR02757 family protein [Telluribacter sp.]|uniref:TIGR02757 family protein n=1 Tax=Telluribacter sp. TaxID=1978767 RepID=UPI002E0FFAF4|nr:TIGR02757 family protein [Telluribacter sp.]
MPVPETEPVPLSGYIVDLLNQKYEQYNRPDFIPHDPISIPNRFSLRQDIEIMGFWASILAWGQRKTIISKCSELVLQMDGAPYDFIVNHQESDLKRFLHFKHRTFNATDTLYFLHFFRDFYREHDSLEEAFLRGMNVGDQTVEGALRGFHDLFCSLEDFSARTRKHIATPARKSSCKRLNMFLRWMVRQDNRGVDFGLWRRIQPGQLVCPCDVHVDRVARHLGLITRPQTDWQTATELTASLRQLDPHDPVKYDFALFGLGIEGYV